MRTKLAPVVINPQNTSRFFSMGFGLWLAKPGVNTVGTPILQQNFFTPEVFEASLRKALQTRGRYVWLFETPRWWSKRTAREASSAYETPFGAARQQD